MTTALLPVDRGSVLVSSITLQQPQQIVTQHLDGEIIKMTYYDEQDFWGISRHKEEYDEPLDAGGNQYAVAAAATIADMQAFGLRLDGIPTRPLAPIEKIPEIFEFEPLSRGGILVEDDTQLPLTVYTRTETYYRILPLEDVAVLRRWEGRYGNCTDLATSELSNAGTLLNTLAEDAGMIAIDDPTGKKIDNTLSDYSFDLFPASITPGDEALREHMAENRNTAFPPTTPKPQGV